MNREVGVDAMQVVKYEVVGGVIRRHDEPLHIDEKLHMAIFSVFQHLQVRYDAQLRLRWSSRSRLNRKYSAASSSCVRRFSENPALNNYVRVIKLQLELLELESELRLYRFVMVEIKTSALYLLFRCSRQIYLTRSYGSMARWPTNQSG